VTRDTRLVHLTTLAHVLLVVYGTARNPTLTLHSLIWRCSLTHARLVRPVAHTMPRFSLTAMYVRWPYPFRFYPAMCRWRALAGFWPILLQR